jgi:hypothetical protein
LFVSHRASECVQIWKMRERHGNTATHKKPQSLHKFRVVKFAVFNSTFIIMVVI